MRLDSAFRHAGLSTYNAHSAVEGESANSKDFADGYDDVAEEEELHFSASC